MTAGWRFGSQREADGASLLISIYVHLESQLKFLPAIAGPAEQAALRDALTVISKAMVFFYETSTMLWVEDERPKL